MKQKVSASLAALTVGGAILFTACQGGGEVSLPTLSPSRTAELSPTVTAPTAALPTVTVPTVTSPTVTRPTPTLPTRTTSESAEPTTTNPGPTPTEPAQTTSPGEPTATPTEPTPSPTETTPESPTPSPTTSETTAVAQPTSPSTTVAAESTSAESQGVPAWVWWLLAAILIALAIAVPVLLRRRRMDRWLDDFANARAEVAWLAHELIPRLRQTGSRQLVAGGLEVSSPRILAAEDQLTALIASAPNDVTLDRSRILRDALRDARMRLEDVPSSGTDETLATELDEIAGELEAALATTDDASGASPTPGATDQPL